VGDVVEPVKLTAHDIRHLLELLDAELATQDVHGELYMVGGAVMCLALNARPATRDVDAFFRPSTLIRQAAARVATKTGVPASWLNDAVKAFLSPRGDFDPFLELPNLSVFTARPEYLLAMKCAAMRLGEEFHDLDDVRYLLRYLNLTTADEALEIVTRYFDEKQLLPKTRLALEELLPS
jgi:predicted nucleotidyltransferase